MMMMTYSFVCSKYADDDDMFLAFVTSMSKQSGDKSLTTYN